jgi:hypothetical protein
MTTTYTTTRSRKLASKGSDIQSRIKATALTRRLMLLAKNPKEATVAAKAILSREGWSVETMQRVAQNRKWNRKPSVQMTLKAAAKLSTR